MTVFSPGFLPRRRSQSKAGRKRPMVHAPGFFSAHKLKAFTRFDQYPEMLIAAKIDVAPELVPSTLEFFCHRFPSLAIALYNEQEHKLYVQSRRIDMPERMIAHFDSFTRALEWTRNVVQAHVRDRLEFSTEWNPAYYDEFYKTQFIERRHNPRLQNQMMPKKILVRDSIEWKSMNERQSSRGNSQLKQFE